MKDRRKPPDRRAWPSLRQRLCPLPSLSQSEKSLMLSSRHGTIGSGRKGNNNAKFTDSISAVLISGSVPPIRMPPRCASRVADCIWAIIPHYVVDGGKQRIILTTLVTPAEVMDNQPMLDLLWHTVFHWHLHPNQVTGDTKYGTIENIKAIEDAHIHA